MARARRKGKTERSDQRYDAEGLSTPLGEVADLSASGARLVAPARPGVRVGDIETVVISSDEQELRLTGEIVWIRKSALLGGRHELGVKFLNVDRVKRAILVDLAVEGRFDEERPYEGCPQARMEIVDLYGILGVARDADEDAIRNAYRALARVHHPDVSSDPDAENVFARIAKAYAILRSPRRRADYDAMLMRAA